MGGNGFPDQPSQVVVVSVMSPEGLGSEMFSPEALQGPNPHFSPNFTSQSGAVFFVPSFRMSHMPGDGVFNLKHPEAKM